MKYVFNFSSNKGTSIVVQVTVHTGHVPGITLCYPIKSNTISEPVTTRVRKLNLGCRFLLQKLRFLGRQWTDLAKKIWGLMTIGQVRSVPNFCQFGPQRAEKRNF